MPPAITEVDLARAADTVVTALAGPGAQAREDQLAAARALVVDGRRALVVQATGWGKSAVYWISARALRDAGTGPVLVVCPLLSLMRDQVAAAARAGLTAVTFNSANVDDWSGIEQQIAADTVDVILVSPERLASPRFTDTVLSSLADRLGLLVIDEAHCISSWGHDFRPDYQRVARLLTTRPDLPVLATTATANARVTDDVAAQLGTDTVVLRGQLARTSLHLGVAPGLSPIERYAWIDDALSRLPGSGIVYALTVAEVERLTGYLASRGHAVAAYTGQMDTAARESVEDQLRANAVKAVVATSALGMGYDKPDLAFCLHVGSPGSPVDYYQQVGRAGRALDTAVVVLLPGPGDERLWQWFAAASIPDPDQAQAVLDTLAGSDLPLSVQAVEAATGVRRSRVEQLLKTLAVDGAVARGIDGWTRTDVPWRYDHDRYARLLAARQGEADLMRTYAHQRACLETVLRRSLDDDVTADARCGRCSVCTGTLAGELPASALPQTVTAATAYLRGLDTPIEPRKMWAGAMGEHPLLGALRGRISPDLAVQEGRAVAFADDPAWAEVAGLLAGPDAEAPDWLVDAMVATLRRWGSSWGARPVAVAAMPSARHPLLVASLARRLGEIGRLPVIDPLTATGPAPDPALAPSARARAIASRLQRTDAPVPDGPVLLIDDTSRSGWTLTVAGALLRHAGATAVLPLVAHKLP